MSPSRSKGGSTNDRDPPRSEALNRSRSGRRRLSLWQALVSRDSFGSVLVLILITYVLSVAVRGPWTSLVLGVQVITVLLSIRVSRARRGIRLVANLAGVVAVSIAIAYLVGNQGRTFLGVTFIASGVLYFIAPVSILRAIVATPEIDREAVLGAINAYLLIGLFFGFLYQAEGSLRAIQFFGAGIGESPAHFMLFSFTTLTTTGYGNLVPASNPGQTFAVMEMLIGQLFLVTAVGKVISAWRPIRWRASEDEGEPSAHARKERFPDA